MDAARTNLGIAEALGAKYLRLFGGPMPADQDRETTLDADRRRAWRDRGDDAAGGVTSLIETHDSFCRSPSILDLYRRGASDKLGVLWDTLHSYRHGESGEETWSALGDRIKLVHVKDAFGNSGSLRLRAHRRRHGAGQVLYRSARSERDIDGYVNFEWEKGWHPEIADPEVALPHFARLMIRRDG